jgi:hypothetical protein
VVDNESDDPLNVTFHNVLLYNDQGLSPNATPTSFYGEQVTMHAVTNTGATTVTLTNSLFAATSGFSGGTGNAYVSSDSGVFQTIGAGSHYLAADSPYRQAGTTNLAAGVLTYLSQRTTYPPLMTSAITADITLGPQASRDFGPPDLGYHYDPLDYCLSAVTLTNTLVLTNGVALGMYGNYGINLGSGAKIIGQGTATTLNRLVRYQSVQELSTNWGNAGSTVSLLNLSSTYTKLPEVWLRFTDLSFLANTWSKRYILNNNTSCVLSNLVLHDCSVCGGALSVFFEGTQGPPTMTVALTNNLVQRGYFSVGQDGGTPDNLIVQAWNNLFQWGTVTPDNSTGTTTWGAYDNLFDKATISSTSIQNSHNGYVTNYSRLSSSLGSDKTLTNSPVYQSSYLGNYYYPTNDGMLSLLIDAGSRFATNAGLYHYTTTTNQVIEGASTVDIGFHFVATDTNGVPIDTNGDGLPDYLSDANGDGAVDSGEIGWNIPGDLGLNVLITRPPNGATVP